MSKPEPRHYLISILDNGFSTVEELRTHMHDGGMDPAGFADVIGHVHDFELALRPRVSDGASTAPQPKREPVDNAEVNAKVLAHLRSNPGTRKFKDITAATGVTGAQLTGAKKALVKAGEVQDEFKAAMSAKMPAVEKQGT